MDFHDLPDFTKPEVWQGHGAFWSEKANLSNWPVLTGTRATLPCIAQITTVPLNPLVQNIISEKTIKEGRKLNLEKLLIKPFPPETLMEAVEKVFQLKKDAA